MKNTKTRDAANAYGGAVKRFGQIAIAGALLLLVLILSTAGADDMDANDCIKQNYWVYENGNWIEKEIIYPWSKCFDLENSEKFDGFAFENVKKPEIGELKKEAKEKVFSVLVNAGVPGEKENKMYGMLPLALDVSVSLANKWKITNDIVNKMDEKELFRFVFRWIVVEDVAKKIKNLDSYGELAIDEDKGLIFVYLNDEKDKNVVKEILKPYVNDGVNVVFLKGKHSSKKLKEWKENIKKSKPADIAITSIGYSTFLNKVIIGIPEINNESLKKLSNYLTMDISLDDVYIEESNVKELSRSDKIRPLIGGIKITSKNSDMCTLGFVAKRNGVKGFITAGHCSSTTNIAFCQPGPGGSGCNQYHSNFVGASTITTCDDSDPYADVAWVPTSQNICSKVYKDSGYHYVVADKNEYGGEIGEYVCKSGFVTGETCGVISGCIEPTMESCNQEIQESFEVDGMGNSGGDSGSPIFKKLFTWYGVTYVSANGLLFGGNSGTNKAYFSSIGNIEMYTGSLEVSGIC